MEVADHLLGNRHAEREIDGSSSETGLGGNDGGANMWDPPENESLEALGIQKELARGKV